MIINTTEKINKKPFFSKIMMFLIFFFIFTNKASATENTQQILQQSTEVIELSQSSPPPNSFSPEAAQEALSKQAGTHGVLQSWVTGNYAAGRFLGLREKLESSGIRIYGGFMNNSFMKIYGGKSKQNLPEYEGLDNLALEVDTKKLRLWPGGNGYLLFENSHGQGITKFVGELQVINSYESPPLTRLMEYWYRQSFFSGFIKVKGGRQDANADFDYLDVGSIYINNTFTMSQNIPLPTFPLTRAAVSGSVQPVKFMLLKGGWYKSIVQNSFNITEMDLFSVIKSHPGKYLSGIWVDTSSFQQSVPPNKVSLRTYPDNYGVYAALQQLIHKKTKKKDDDRGLVLIGRFSWVPQDRNQITQNYSAGLAYKGLFYKRTQDITGIGCGFAVLNNAFHSDGYKNEIVIETFHKFQIIPWMYIQPDFQFFRKPGGIYKNAYIVGIRVSFLI